MSKNECYSREEREEILKKMKQASNVFYAMATGTGCHPFIEFTGLMNEYIKMCEDAHAKGIDFTQCNAHSGQALPMRAWLSIA